MSVKLLVSEYDSGTPSSNLVLKYGDSGVGTSSLDLNTYHPPVKKQPRQWAAWTRQEEESFFNALRQVGKNFEKITNCVQSKNKDQVRHYYYRLVRRMNKLLGPDLCLDAKNSKVTNSAMLRWWSLLEKYSCKPSKLHLKPRRYKLFVETLENQLWRDRRKYIRRHPSLSDHNSASVPNIISDHGRPLNQDILDVKEVPADSQKIPKPGTGKGSSVKRDTDIGFSRGNRKPELSISRTSRQRRKIGISTAAYKKWEKAAMAGVSLVADAAEHLERTTVKELENVRGEHVQNGMEPLREEMHVFPSTSPNPLMETNVQGSVKLKLQLFPMAESIRRTLEMDNHNPHLELTLSTRKKISSVMEHLNRKWGNSSIAHGDLMLLPYTSPSESLVDCQKWNKDCNLNASDVHALVGSPPVFRLRYGWFTNTELGSGQLQLPILSTPSTVEECKANMNDQTEQEFDLLVTSNLQIRDECEEPSELIKDNALPTTKQVSSVVDPHSGMHGCLPNMDSSVNILRNLDNVPSLCLPRMDNDLDTAMRLIDSSDDFGVHKNTSVGNWADSLTNISVGQLLSEASQDGGPNCVSSPVPFSCRSVQQTSFCSDSFDAAIAAHICNYESEAVGQSAPLCHASSIWDAEETRDEFSFQKTSPLVENFQGVSKYTSLEILEQIARPISVAAESSVQEVHCHEEFLPDDPPQENFVDEPRSDTSSKYLDGLTDIYWPDSLGPLDLDIPSSRYHSEDVILSDSLGGLSRLIASSLDAFQNCSFFGSDKKEPTSVVEARETAPVTDYKIKTEV
ncbi:hypothetical protein Leryth_000907 [Lithospermum erythrorhizon]|nr:hypothetical protein Leryth_000907 [Lithospermum erythrorhizon]